MLIKRCSKYYSDIRLDNSYEFDSGHIRKRGKNLLDIKEKAWTLCFSSLFPLANENFGSIFSGVNGVGSKARSSFP